MPNIHQLLGFALLLFAATPQTAVSQERKPVGLTTGEINKLVRGNTTIGTFADRQLSYIVYCAPDGRMIGKFINGTGTRIETGVWRAEDDLLYGRWDELKGGKENGFQYRSVGDNVHAYNSATGKLDRIQHFVQGDPFGLDSESNEKAVQAAVQRWVDLWNSGTETFNQARFDSFTDLFADGNRYLAIDDFTGEVLTIRSYKEYASTWIPVMQGFKNWRIELVGEVDVSMNGESALTTFKFKGNGELKNGKTVTGFTYATLVWRKSAGRWELIHEHLTGSQE